MFLVYQFVIKTNIKNVRKLYYIYNNLEDNLSLYNGLTIEDRGRNIYNWQQSIIF